MGNSKGDIKVILLWLWKVWENTAQQHPGDWTKALYPVCVCTSSLLSPGSHGKSGRLTLRIGFFSGSLNGLGYSLRVRVHWLAWELFYSRGAPLLILSNLCGVCQIIYAVTEQKRMRLIERPEWRLWWNKQQRLEAGNNTKRPVCQLAQSLQSYCTF